MNPTYVYIAWPYDSKEKRNHLQATARRVRFSVESMTHPAFLAAENNEDKHAEGLSAADVLIVIVHSKEQLSSAPVQEAVDFFQETGKKIIAFVPDAKIASEIDAIFIKEETGSMSALLDEALFRTEGEEDLPEAEDPAPPVGKFDNIKNILFICAFIAAACLVLRLLLTWLKG